MENIKFQVSGFRFQVMRALLAMLLLLPSSLFPLNGLLPLSAQPATAPLTAGRTPEGITYFLPKTVLNIRLQVEKRVYQPGQFSHYASRYLHIEGVEQEQETDHQMLQMEVSLTGIRDTSKCYSLQLKGGKCETAEVRLADDGVLLAMNDEPLAASKSQTRLMEYDWENPDEIVSGSKGQLAKSKVDPWRFLSDDIRMAGSTAKKAELTARQMDDLIERRQQLLMGDADDQPQDDAQLQRLLAAIDEEYDALMTLFTGVTLRDTTWQTITYCPNREVQRDVLFRLSRQRGIVDSDDLSGVPYYISIDDLYKTDTAKPLLADTKRHDGLYVNVPGRIRLSLHRGTELLRTFELSCAQFGFVELRNMQLFKRYVMHIQLHPALGTIVKSVADIPEKEKE